MRRISSYSPRVALRKGEQPGLPGWLRALFLSVCVVATAGSVYYSYPAQSHAAWAWVAWVPFLWGITQVRRARGAFLYGWITAFLFNAGIFYWIYYTCVHGGGLSVGLSAAAWLGLSGLIALQNAFFGASCYYLTKTNWLFAPLVACGFVTFEWLHQTLAFYGLGFPWIMWGYTQWSLPEGLQIASFAGVYGVSFLLLLVSALISQALARGGVGWRVAHLLVAAGVLFGVFSWGDSRVPLHTKTADTASQVAAAVLQPNIDQYKKWDPAFEQEIVDNIADFGRELETENVLLTVWPESVIPGELSQEPYINLMENIALRADSYQIVGSSVSLGDYQYVGAYMLTPGNPGFQTYRKVKLVPFGEYIPLEKTIRRLFPHVEILGQLGIFTPGPPQQELLDMDGMKLGSTICYEAIFPQLWRTQRKQGARLFVNLTNDAWFFDTAAPHQHLAANVLRAVETGTPVLRAANTGISAVIDPFGRIEQKTRLFTRDALFAQVEPAAEDSGTFYSTYGNVFVWLCAVVFFTCLIFAMVFLYD